MKLLDGVLSSRSPSYEQDVKHSKNLVGNSDPNQGSSQRQDKDKVTRQVLDKKMETTVDIGTDCQTDTLSWRDTAFVVFTFIIFGFIIAYGGENSRGI